jgi:Peptidase propeptide and YPEB domain
MSGQGIYKVHKWLAVSVSGFFLAWLISGIVMTLPRLAPERPPISDAVDIKKVSVSAKEVLSNLGTVVGDLSQVKAVTLKRIADSDVYEIITTSRGPLLIDAESGKLFSITAQKAEAIAKRHMASGPRELKVELLSRHEFTYPWGPLPVYRVVVPEDRSTFYYVSARDGTVSRSDRETRIRNAIASLHTLDPVKLLIERKAFRKGMLILAGMVGIAAVCTGLALAVKRRP